MRTIEAIHKLMLFTDERITCDLIDEMYLKYKRDLRIIIIELKSCLYHKYIIKIKNSDECFLKARAFLDDYEIFKNCFEFTKHGKLIIKKNIDKKLNKELAEYCKLNLKVHKHKS